jgi:hypothetical protein
MALWQCTLTPWRSRPSVAELSLSMAWTSNPFLAKKTESRPLPQPISASFAPEMRAPFDFRNFRKNTAAEC